MKSFASLTMKSNPPTAAAISLPVREISHAVRSISPTFNGGFN
ncbi:MAG: hypothetical protein ACI3XX_00955 [Eubacteriales bacterium]